MKMKAVAGYTVFFLCVSASIALENHCSDPEDDLPDDLVLVEYPSESLSEGAQLRVKCAPGFISHGRRHLLIKCVMEGRKLVWKMPELKQCRPVSCGHPGDVKHGSLQSAVFTFPHAVEYRCDTGYRSVGRTRIYCQSSGYWDTVPPKCEVVRCGEPEVIGNGTVEFGDDSYGSTARYSCTQSYRIEGEAQRTCGADGRWTGLPPTCKEVRCPPPGTPSSGGWTVPREQVEYPVNSIIRFYCPESLTLDGSDTTVCLPEGFWLFDPPLCMAKCRVPEQEGGYIKQNVGWIRYLPGHPRDRALRPGSMVPDAKLGYLLSCIKGFEIQSKNSLELQCKNGKWTPVADAVCSPKSCINVPQIKNGERTKEIVNHGEWIEYVCHKGYDLQKNGGLFCRLGEILGQKPSCNPKPCMNITRIENGRPGKETLKHGEFVEYICHEGYELQRGDMVKCRYGEIEGRIPSCHPRACRQLPTVLNGSPLKDIVQHNESVQYKCDERYLMEGYNILSCMFGTLQGNPPKCKKDFCDKEDFQIPTEGMEQIRRHRNGERLIYGCMQGYSKTDLQAVCEDGRWTLQSTSKGPCTILNGCQLEKRAERFKAYNGNRRVMPNNTVPHGTTLRYHCEPLGSLILIGPRETVCKNGTWDTTPPYCYSTLQHGPRININLRTEGTQHDSAVGPGGTLYIQPDTNLVVECMHGSKGHMYISGSTRTSQLQWWWFDAWSKLEHRVQENELIRIDCSNEVRNNTVHFVGRRLWKGCPEIERPVKLTRNSPEAYDVSCEPPYKNYGPLRIYCLPFNEWHRRPVCRLSFNITNEMAPGTDNAATSIRQHSPGTSSATPSVALPLDIHQTGTGILTSRAPSIPAMENRTPQAHFVTPSTPGKQDVPQFEMGILTSHAPPFPAVENSTPQAHFVTPSTPGEQALPLDVQQIGTGILTSHAPSIPAMGNSTHQAHWVMPSTPGKQDIHQIGTGILTSRTPSIPAVENSTPQAHIVTPSTPGKQDMHQIGTGILTSHAPSIPAVENSTPQAHIVTPSTPGKQDMHQIGTGILTPHAPSIPAVENSTPQAHFVTPSTPGEQGTVHTGLARTCMVEVFRGEVSHGVAITVSQDHVAAGASFDAHCENDTEVLLGDSGVVKCREDGTWSFARNLRCAVGCHNFAPYDPSPIINGRQETYTAGNSITISCPVGYAMQHQVERLLCVGQWTPRIHPKCIPGKPAASNITALTSQD